MFSFFSLRAKTPVKRLGFAVLILVLLAMAVGSCKAEPDENYYFLSTNSSSLTTLRDILGGEWVSPYDKYVIEGDTLVYYVEDWFTGDWGMAYTGSIQHVVKLPIAGKETEEMASGVIIFQFVADTSLMFVPPVNPSGFTALYFKGKANGNKLKFADVSAFGAFEEANLGDAIDSFTGEDHFDNINYTIDWSWSSGHTRSK